MSRSRKYTHYKGLKSYLDVVSKNERLDTLFSSVINSSNMVNEINYKMNEIKIDKEWILKIKEYLPFISAAISEDRKFMRNYGEDVKIEKVKKVGRESVIDLAKSSKKIDEFDPYDTSNIKPKEILVTQKLDDYGIYENKFLYFLIYTLKSFIDIRLSKLEHAKNQVFIETKLKNKSRNSDGEFSYEFNILDTRFDKADTDESDENNKLIAELINFKSEINKFLHTSLIQEVSKLGLIKPPIDHTNVLKNDVNFIKCLELYEYLASFKGDGYEIKEINHSFNNLSEKYIHLFGYLPLLISSLSYCEIKDLFTNLENKYIEEIESEKNELEKYILNVLSTNELSLEKIKEYINKVNIEIHSLKGDLDLIDKSYKDKISLLNEKIRVLEITHEKEILDKDREFVEYKENKEKEVSLIKEEFEKKNSEVENLRNTLILENESYKNRIIELESFIRANNILSDKNFEKDEANEIYFNKLELEKNAFDSFFNKKYKETIKVVKKEMKEEIKKEIKEKKNKKKEG